MLSRREAIVGKKRPQAQLSHALSFQPPTAGMNLVTPPGQLAANEAVYMYNLHPSVYGVRVRDGWQEWQTGIGYEVRTIIPVAGDKSDSTQDKLFIACQDGIYDVSLKGGTPAKVVDFATKTLDAGWGNSINFTGIGGHFVLYCDEANGYYYYGVTSGTWAKVTLGTGAGQVSNVDPAQFAQVCVWKNYVWFVQRNTGSAWYLPVGQFTGAATEFKLGNKFTYGGELAGLFNYTTNGGLGVDEFFVAISRQGDLIVYQGTDPNVAGSFGVKGSWYIGQVPAGRRLAAYFGGELLVLSTRGVTAVSRILGGAVASEDSFASKKIAPLIARAMANNKSSYGWSMKLHAARSLLVVTVPYATGSVPSQYAMNTDTGAWSVFRDVPMRCAEAYQGNFYFGTADGRIAMMTGTADAITTSGTNATGIKWSMLTAYTDAGMDGRNKRVQLIQMRFLGDSSAPACTAAARYGYDTSEPALSVAAAGSSAVSTWGYSSWNSGSWPAGETSSSVLIGATGIGQVFAVAAQGTSLTELSLATIQTMFDAGGFL